MPPKNISVIITSYNQRKHLIKAVDSVLNQTLSPFEIIIIDDCSSDKSQDLIKAYAAKHDLIRPLFHQENKGVAEARNTALQNVRGDLVTCLDGDDRIFPRKLEEEFQTFTANPDADMVYSNYAYVNLTGEVMDIWGKHQDLPQGNIFLEVFARDFPKRNLFRCELINYQLWKQVGFYDPSYKLYEDWEVRLRLTRSLKAAYCPKTLVEYWRHSEGLSSANKKRHLVWVEKVYKNNQRYLEPYDTAEKQYVRNAINAWKAHIAQTALIEILNQHNAETSFSKAASPYLGYFYKEGKLYFPFLLIMRMAGGMRIYDWLFKIGKQIKQVIRNLFN